MIESTASSGSTAGATSERVWQHLYGGERGWLAILDAERKGDKLEDAETNYFPYPKAAAKAADYALKRSAEGREVYFCAHLLTERRRKKENAAPVRALWVDLDGCEVPNGELKPTVVVESSPGKRHAYYRLTDAIPPEAAEGLNKRIAAAIGADPSGFDLTQILRVPGTRNRKYEAAPTVKLLSLNADRSYSAGELDRTLPRSDFSVPGHPHRVAEPVRAVIANGSRNQTLTSLAGTLRRRGLEEEAIYAALTGINQTQCQPPLLESEVKQIAASVSRYEPEQGPADRNDKGAAKTRAVKQRNLADRLIDYALATGVELFLDQHEQPHALVDGEAVALTSRAYPWLINLMWGHEEISVGGEVLKTAANTLAAFAYRDGKTRKLYTRAAWYEGAVYYQLRKGRVWKIDRDGHALAEDPPVVFRSISNLKALPDPVSGGSLDDAAAFTNIKSELGRRLWKANLVTTLLEHIPRPIEEYTGEAGAGKSTNSRVKKRLLDPTSPESVRLDQRDFLQKADHAYIVMLDNLNSIPEWGVDTLCRLVTGEGDSKRVLYTDDNDFVFEMKRAIILNGINQPADRSDARDRTLPIELRRIPDNERKCEEELWEAFGEEHPKLLGAVLDALSRALKAKESVTLSRRPRLADWGEYAAAVYEAEGWSDGEKKGTGLFLEDWEKVVRIQNRGTLEGSSVAQVVLAFMQDRDEYTGLATDLYGELKNLAEYEMNIDVIRDRTWPRSPSWLWRRIKEVKPMLRAVGIQAENKSNAKGSWIVLTKDSNGGDDGSPPTDGSKMGDASIKEADASMLLPSSNPDTYGDPGSSGSYGSICGHISGSLPQTTKDKGGEKRDTPPILLKATESASSATTASIGGPTSAAPARDGRSHGDGCDCPHCNNEYDRKALKALRLGNGPSKALEHYQANDTPFEQVVRSVMHYLGRRHDSLDEWEPSVMRAADALVREGAVPGDPGDEERI
jgi:hypothetical protein